RIKEAKVHTKRERHDQPQSDTDKRPRRNPPARLRRNIRREIVDQVKSSQNEDERNGPLNDGPNRSEETAESVTCRERLANRAAVQNDRERSQNQDRERYGQTDGNESHSPPPSRLFDVVSRIERVADRAHSVRRSPQRCE